MAADPSSARRRPPWHWIAAGLLSLPLVHAQGTGLFDIAAHPPGRVVGAEYFGTHFHRLDRAESGAPATAWPGTPVGAFRVWDSSARWADLEPSPGRFDFTRLDDNVDQALARGAKVTMVLGSTPRWASARPQEPCPYGLGCSAEPRELADWDRYVRTVMRRYKGRITQYELWNEPYFSDLSPDRDQPGAFFSGSVATMVELARRARAAMDAVDPRAQLLSPGFVGSPERLALFLHAGGGRYIDAVAYHFYVDDDAQLVQLHARVRDVMAQAGLARLALLDTESGFAIRGVEGQAIEAGQPRIDRRVAAALLARSMILGAYLGLDRFYQYAWDDARMGMLLPDGRTEAESARAFAAVRRWLVGSTLQACRSLAGGGVRCDAERGDAHLAIGWRPAGLSGAPVDARVVDDLALAQGEQPTAIDHATDGVMPIDGASRRHVPLPADGMPVAVWSRSALGPRHARVADER